MIVKHFIRICDIGPTTLATLKVICQSFTSIGTEYVVVHSRDNLEDCPLCPGYKSPEKQRPSKVSRRK